MNKNINARKVNPHQRFKQTVTPPDALYLQFRSVDTLLNVGVCSKHKDDELLYKILKLNFPVNNVNNNIILDFVNYIVEPPKYTPEECLQLGISYAVCLTVKFRIFFVDKKDVLEQDVYFGEIPYMTSRGSYIYGGVERVCVTQIRKVPGISFISTNKNHNDTDYVCKIIPKKGNWIEIFVGGGDQIYICFNKVIKILLSDYLKVFGFETQKELYDIFDLAEEIDCTQKVLEKNSGKVIAENIQCDTNKTNKNGEKAKKILLPAYSVIDQNNISTILKANKKTILVFKCNSDGISLHKPFINTVINMSTDNRKSLALSLYALFNSAYNSNAEDMPFKYMVGIVSDEKLYSLGSAARQKMNSVIGCDEKDSNSNVLSKSDFIHIIVHFMGVINGQKTVDDLDHCGNKCLYSIEEQLYEQLCTIFNRISKLAKERLNVCEREGFNIYNLINVGIFSSFVNQFFATNPFMQFMDELNPLAEVLHKRRLSTVGVGSITSESRSTGIRDIHYSQYGKICPVETPEGINIGLVSALASYAKCNEYGVIITPYRVVKNGVIDLDNNHIVYLDANQDIYKNIAPANIIYDEKGQIIDEYVDVRTLDTFKRVSRNNVDLIDISPNQAFSVGTSLIPFLENIDASRALMGTNMQRQAVPLINPQAPIVGTGYEKKICDECRDILKAEYDGVVKYVDSQKIIIEYNLSEEQSLCSYNEQIKEYNLIKFQKTNQKTCRNYRPIVEIGEKVKKGDALVEGFATANGELALGVNLKVAFLPYRGYNYEDAIVISDRVLKEDLFTSIYLETYETTLHKTKLCDEEFSKDLHRMNINDRYNLGDDGIVKEGAFVCDGDILAGKMVPGTQSNTSPETKLLKEIFNKNAYDMDDEPLVMPPFSQGVVIKSKTLKRQNLSKHLMLENNKKIEVLRKQYIKVLDDLRSNAISRFTKILKNKKSNLITQEYGEIVMKDGEIFTEDKIRDKFFEVVSFDQGEHSVLKYQLFLEGIPIEDWTKDKKTNSLLEVLIKNTLNEFTKIRNKFFKEYHNMQFGDYLESDVISKAQITVAHKRKLKIGDKLSGRHGNKGVVSKIVRVEDMPFDANGTPVDLVLTPLGIISRMSEGQVYDALLGLVGEKLGCKFITPVFSGFDINSIEEQIEKAGLPHFGETQLYDGLTGEKFDQTCTVGELYFIKLNHMVDDKIHARSIGKYSMISQQPLSGRAHFGGQRFGEMEVWALEAYGAANLLQEMLTIKSDDVYGRKKAYESIIKGETIIEYGVPESFKVLVHEIRGIGFDLVFE